MRPGDAHPPNLPVVRSLQPQNQILHPARRRVNGIRRTQILIPFYGPTLRAPILPQLKLPLGWAELN
jgi:hypothetical protein